MQLAKYAHLLARLAYEDDFRQRFAADPERTLLDMGIVDYKQCPAPPVVLAHKEVLQKEYESRLERIAIVPTEPMCCLL